MRRGWALASVVALAIFSLAAVAQPSADAAKKPKPGPAVPRTIALNPFAYTGPFGSLWSGVITGTLGSPRTDRGARACVEARLVGIYSTSDAVNSIAVARTNRDGSFLLAPTYGGFLANQSYLVRTLPSRVFIRKGRDKVRVTCLDAETTPFTAPPLPTS